MKRLALFTAAFASVSMLAGPAVLPSRRPIGMDWSRSNQSVSIWSIFSPGADFRGYTKVMVEPTEVAFAKNWQRDYNRASRALSGRVSDRDVEEAVSEGVKAAHDIFTAAWTKGGYAVVTEPGPDVLRVKTGIINITVNAPDQPTSGTVLLFLRRGGLRDVVRGSEGFDDGCASWTRHRSGDCRRQ